MPDEIKADFTIERYGNPLAIVDLANESGTTSVTNDAEAVVAYLHENGLLPLGTRLIYRDTMDTWDEIIHDGLGHLVGFKYLGGTDLDEALRLAKERP